MYNVLSVLKKRNAQIKFRFGIPLILASMLVIRTSER